MTDVTDSKDVGWFNSSVDEAWWHKPLQRLLSAGPLPRHIAFVMDGNRRYARSHGSSTVIDGHIKGFEQLTKILRWCRDLCVEEVTIYAFSIENFKRPKDEVDGLMELFSKKLKQLLDEKKQLTENDVAVRFFGRLSVLPISHQRMIAQIMRLTSEHKARVVNVCIAYTAQDEITRAFEYIRKGIQKGIFLQILSPPLRLI
ncbi:hypothetical protein AB6A40_011275 [Gnathostoma spinigerum]|uniref:Alkyl transferase n=1 Tax=Gnathostoma spinigerum TaxID=75299 RepID=A0ABD6F2P4_9BILA